MSLVRERYRVDLPELQSSCEVNYARLMRLLPDMRASPAPRRIALSQGEHALGELVLSVLESSPYTSLLEVRQEGWLAWLPLPRFEVRVYHDARMAEVVAAQRVRRLRGLYRYPNAQMHQPDEKTQLNLFLGEWLEHCLACGHEPVAIRADQ